MSRDDIERVKMNIVSGMIYRLDSVAGKVGQLAYYQTITGRPDLAQADIARYENVTPDEVIRVYNEYIKDKPAVVMSIVPHGQLALRAAEDTWLRPDRMLPDYGSAAVADLDYRPASDDFDRSVVPPAGENPAISLPRLWRGKLPNGVRVLGTRNVETPTTAISLRIEAGQRNERLDELGLAALTAAVLNESTERSTVEELSNRLQMLGSAIQFEAGDEFTTATLLTLTRNLDETLAIPRREAARAKVRPRRSSPACMSRVPREERPLHHFRELGQDEDRLIGVAEIRCQRGGLRVGEALRDRQRRMHTVGYTSLVGSRLRTDVEL